MSFVSLYFILFLPILCITYWLCPLRWRNSLLLVASVLFYMLPHPTYGVMLLWVWASSYLAVRWVSRDNPQLSRLWVGVLGVLLPMLFFKIKAPVVDAFFPQGLPTGIPGLNWIFPLGLSCYSLQAVSLIIDVYKGRTQRDPSLVNHALYVSFLPTVTSGPILHSTDLMWQITANRGGFDRDMAFIGTKRLIWGLFMKVVVADRFGIYVNAVLDHSTLYNSPTVFIALLCYTVQIYCDFAGYSHMAIGTANLLGFDMPENFRRPLFSMGLKELWTRWHISLSSWLRDYVYFPLGGSRCKTWRMCLNLLATFAVSGMWHGVRLSYLCWGVGNGLMVMLEHFLPLRRWRKLPVMRVAWSVLSICVLSILWAFFFDHIEQSIDILSVLFTKGFDGGWIMIDTIRTKATLIAMAGGFAIVAMRDIYEEFFPTALASWYKGRSAVTFMFYITLILLVLVFGVMETGQFIYLRF